MDEITFLNKQFRVRKIKLPDLGYVLISTTNLNDVLMVNGSEYVSDVAQKIDEQIYFFVEENEIELNKKELTKIVKL